MTNNNNFNLYIEKLMNHIYAQKLYRLAYTLETNSSHNTNPNDLNILEGSITNSNILPDIDMEDIVRKYIESSSDRYNFRKAISIEKNYLYPKLFDNNNNPRLDHNYTKALILLWENDMDEFYIEEAYSRFNEKGFFNFVKNNLHTLLDDIALYVKKKKEGDKITIKCSSKDEILSTIKSMILDKSLDFKWAEFLVDLDSLRKEMLTFAGNLSIYSEFDKLEDDTRYCLDNHCKYNSQELFNILTNEKGFIWVEGTGLISK